MSVRLLYVPKTSVIHSLDPRTKAFVWAASAIPAIASQSILVSLTMFLFTLAIATVGKVSRQYLRNILTVVVPVFVPIFLIQGLFNPAGKTAVLYLLPWLYFRREGIVFAAVLMARLLAIFGGAYLLTLTTKPGDLMASMQKLGLPLRVAYPLFSALQIVPTIEARLQLVKDAQMSRGLRLQKVGMVQKLKNFIPLLTPLLLGAIEEAYRRSIALEARGFSSKVKKTFLHELKFNASDLAFIVSTVLSVLALTLFATSITPSPNPWSL